jgi:hypothetical protein
MRPQNFGVMARRRFIGELLIHGQCLHRLPPALVSRLPFPISANDTWAMPPAIQTRNLNIPKFFKRKTRNPLPDQPPGYETVKALSDHFEKKIGAAPGEKDVQEAFTKLVDYAAGATVRDELAALMLTAYEYLRAIEAQRAEDKGKDTTRRNLVVSKAVVQKALVALRGGKPSQTALSKLIFDDLFESYGTGPNGRDWFMYVTALCNSGAVDDAAHLCRKHSGKLPLGEMRKVWEKVLERYTKDQNEEGLLKSLGYLVNYMVKNKEPKLLTKLYYYPIELYCGRGDLINAKNWYDQGSSGGTFLTLPAYVTILRACLRLGERKWGRDVLQTMMHGTKLERWIMSKEAWDIAIHFSGSLDGTKEVDKSLQAMIKHAVLDSGPEANVETLNGLVATAIDQNDFAAAEKYLQVFQTRGIEPNIATLDLKMKMFIHKRDFNGAISTFMDLKFTQDITPEFTADAPQLLIQEMANQYPNCDIRAISAIYKDLVDWKVFVTPETLGSLLKVYLSESSFSDVQIILNRHVGHYSSRKRKELVLVMVDYIQRLTTTVEDAWEAYILLIRSLPETSINFRHRIMNTFFELGSPLLAVRVLDHISKSQEVKASKYIYTAAFVGIGQSRSVQALQQAHRQLNIDPYVEVDTPLRNSLMFAHSLCGLYHKALFIYEEIEYSREGPDHATISIVLDICGRHGEDGLNKLRHVWARYRKSSTQLSENNAASYLEALTRLERWDEAWSFVKNMESELGFPPGTRVYDLPSSSILRFHC